MENLFRIALRRPPVATSEDEAGFSLAQASDFQRELAGLVGRPGQREQIKAAARNYASGQQFVSSPKDLGLAAEIEAFRGRLDALLAGDEIRRADLEQAIADSFGQSAAALAASDGFKDAVGQLKDTITAIKYLPEQHARPIEQLTVQFRHLQIVERVAADRGFPAGQEDVRRFRRAALRLADKAGLASVISTADRRKEFGEILKRRKEERDARLGELFKRQTELDAALSEIAVVRPDQLASDDGEAIKGVSVDDEFSEGRLSRQRLDLSRQIGDLTVQALAGKLRAERQQDERQGPDLTGQAQLLNAAAGMKSRLFESAEVSVGGTPNFLPQALAAVSLRLPEGGAERLSEGTRSVLKERGLDPSKIALDAVTNALEDDLQRATDEIERLAPDVVTTSVKRVGQTLITIEEAQASQWATRAVAPWLAPVETLSFASFSFPSTKGEVQPAGIADLLIVKQQLVGYEGVDIAHIENVIRGEKKTREHINRRETETFSFLETETTSSEERSLETTDRFEMTRETAETIKTDMSLKAGLEVSGKYGPVVEFSASAEGAISRSKEKATKAASTFAQDVTERSVRKIAEKVVARESLKTTTEVKETNTHSLDNTGGVGHISAVYQWVNKIYEAQMFNYGLRMMFDFMIPEPAVFLIEVLKSAHAEKMEIEKPTPFPLKPDQVTTSNYHYWVKKYRATDVSPPPPIFKTVSHDWSAGGGDKKTDYTHSSQLAIEEGYEAIEGSIASIWNTWQDDAVIDLALGRRVFRRSNDTSWVWVTSLSNETGSIPLAVATWRVSHIAVAVEVKCRRTATAMMQWRLDTHAKLTTAYLQRKAEYEEKLAAARVQAGVEIEGKNPALNEEMMRDELRKYCISLITDQHFDLFDAVETSGSGGLPQIDIDEAMAEGVYVRFFEQAFEWENMTFVNYPYFWGRKSKWRERVSFEDPDPLFNEFLKAGYCRVSVPVRPGFEGAVDHFLEFGELWEGGPLPAITSDLYLPIAEEIAERLDRPGDEIPQGDPWTVKVPTTLVKLRSDDALPRWEKNAAGEWVEV